MDDKFKLSRRELEVMQTLWSIGKPMTAAEIGKEAKLSVHTVQTVIKSLLKKKYVGIADIGYSGTVLARFFSPSFTAADYIKNNFTSSSNEGLTLQIVSTLIQEEENTEVINELEDILENRKKELGEE